MSVYVTLCQAPHYVMLPATRQPRPVQGHLPTRRFLTRRSQTLRTSNQCHRMLSRTAFQAFALLCLFAFAHASTQPYPFTPCGSGHVQNISIDINPDPPVKGAKVNIKVAGFVDEKVNAGTYQIDVTYVGIPIFSKTGSICSYIKCPLASGPIAITKSVTLPSFAPSGTYHAQMQGVDSTGSLLFCVGVDLNI